MITHISSIYIMLVSHPTLSASHPLCFPSQLQQKHKHECRDSCKYTHSRICTRTYSSHSYLYDTGLGGMPVRCEECDGIIGSCGLSPPITQQSGLVLIFLWKHLGWKWCRKQQVAQQATPANPGALECVHSLAFINTNTLLCLAGSCTHSMTSLVSSKEA